MNISREEIILILQIDKHQFQDFNYVKKKNGPRNPTSMNILKNHRSEIIS